MRQRFVLFLLLLSATSLHAWSYLGFQQLTVDSTSGGVGFTSSTINAGGAHPAATQAQCRLETAEIRYTINGTTVTTAVGTLLEVGDVLVLTGNDVLNNFRAIRTGGTSGVLSCNFTTP